jgi:glucose 1-dehydrogenase
MLLRDRVAVVTGAERGIGRAIAIAYGHQGASVVVNYFQSQSAADEVVAEIRATGSKAIALRADVSNLEDHATLINAVLRTFQRLDVLVNNAGIQANEPVLEAQEETWDRILGVNLKGAYFLSCRAAREMQNVGRGKIICVSSIHDVEPMRQRSIYCISKAGIRMAVKSLALELAEHNVQVNAISPGAVLTDLNRKNLNEPTRRENLIHKIPAGRIGCPEDITGAAVFLASAGSDYITGTTVYVDGGLLLN